LQFTDKQLLIFDLDGTLVDSAPDLANAINQMLITIGRVPFSSDMIRSWVGNGAHTLVSRALSGDSVIASDLTPEVVNQALDVFLAIYRDNVCIDSVLYPQVLATLRELKKRQYRLAIVTNKPLEFVAPILQHLGLSDIFEQILGGDSLAKKKPDPLPLKHLSELLGIAPMHCLMVGDSKNDIVAAKRANIQSVGVTYGYNYGEDIAVYEPDLVTSDFAQLLKLLAPLNNKEV